MIRRVSGLSALLLAAAAPLGAQAAAYPALQPSQIAEREYNFALADVGGGNNGGTALIFQWREGMGNPKLQFTMDAGMLDSNVGLSSTLLIIGGGLAYQLTTASTEMPFDIVLAGGLGLSFADGGNSVHLPFGVAVGHRFPLEGAFAISPFVHPRLSWNRASVGGTPPRSSTSLDVDIGGNFELNPRMAVRLAATLGDSDAVGLSLAWTPRGMRK